MKMNFVGVWISKVDNQPTNVHVKQSLQALKQIKGGEF